MAIKSKWGARLKKAASVWKQSEEAYKEAFGAENLAEDTYVVKLRNCELKLNNKEQLTIVRSHVILEGDFKGIPITDRFNLESDWGAVRARRWFLMLGKDAPENSEEIEELLVEINDEKAVCKGRFSRNNGFANLDITSVIGEDYDGSEGGEGGEGTEIDLESMDKDELRALIKENELDIDGWRKMDEDALREAIAEAISGSEEGSEGEEGEEGGESEEGSDDSVDLDSLDKDGLLKLIEENEIDSKDLGFKNKLLMKKATEKQLRKALEEALGGTEEGGEEGGEEGSDDDELLEQAKVFCGTWGVEVAEDADLDDIKEAISGCSFPEKEVDDDEEALLKSLELESCIQRKSAKKIIKKK